MRNRFLSDGGRVHRCGEENTGRMAELRGRKREMQIVFKTPLQTKYLLLFTVLLSRCKTYAVCIISPPVARKYAHVRAAPRSPPHIVLATKSIISTYLNLLFLPLHP